MAAVSVPDDILYARIGTDTETAVEDDSSESEEEAAAAGDSTIPYPEGQYFIPADNAGELRLEVEAFDGSAVYRVIHGTELRHCHGRGERFSPRSL